MDIVWTHTDMPACSTTRPSPHYGQRGSVAEWGWPKCEHSVCRMDCLFPDPHADMHAELLSHLSITSMRVAAVFEVQAAVVLDGASPPPPSLLVRCCMRRAEVWNQCNMHRSLIYNL